MTAAAEQLEAAIVAGTQNESGLPVLDARKLRGAMIWPAEGTVVEGFGDRKHPRFGTTTPHPGVEIEVAPGAAIRAVLAGQVVFARRFPGYGNTVLLDHGGGHMTVYARAAALNVTEGQIVAQEDILGTGGQYGADGGPPTIYFEFREAGKAVDPTIWLKKQSSHRREG
jgi:septal ring factor EnvC (AmiA/AmiB activator)